MAEPTPTPVRTPTPAPPKTSAFKVPGEGSSVRISIVTIAVLLVAWTVVARGLPGFDSPYALGTIALDAGPSFIGQLHDWQGKALRAGMRVRLAIGRIKNEKDGTEVVGPKFVPVED